MKAKKKIGIASVAALMGGIGYLVYKYVQYRKYW